MRTAIVGGGAAGFFLAINLKELCPQMEVTIFEKSRKVLAKVEVSGGGRCNCTNSFAAVRDLSEVYPRGHRLMKRLFKTFDYRDAYTWFERHGVRLVTQDDNCVFPASQDSHTIINLFLAEARRHGISIRTESKITSLGELADYDFIAITTGGGTAAMAGVPVVEAVPSLFTFSIADEDLQALMGTVVDDATAFIPGTGFRASGPLLITHWGMSGPAILKLSSHAARELHDHHYQMPLSVNWTSRKDPDILQQLQDIISRHPQKQLNTIRPFDLPSRLWKQKRAEPSRQHPLQRQLPDSRPRSLQGRVRHLWRHQSCRRQPHHPRKQRPPPRLFCRRSPRHRRHHRRFQLPGRLDHRLHRRPSHFPAASLKRLAD